MTIETVPTTITRELVPEDQRLAITEKLFGVHFPLPRLPVSYWWVSGKRRIVGSVRSIYGVQSGREIDSANKGGLRKKSTLSTHRQPVWGSDEWIKWSFPGGEGAAG